MSYEETLIYHGAPTILGIKPANLISLTNTYELRSFIEFYNQKNTVTKIFILCECDKKLLILLYNIKIIQKHLNERKISRLLNEYGYYRNNLSQNLEHLKKRFTMIHNFPHEIGLFLGYPLNDIYGFIKNKPCKYVGYWKVYQNVDIAKKTFNLYDTIRNNLITAFRKNSFNLI